MVEGKITEIEMDRDKKTKNLEEKVDSRGLFNTRKALGQL